MCFYFKGGQTMFYWSSEKCRIVSIERFDSSKVISSRSMVIHVEVLRDNTSHTIHWASGPTIMTENLFLANKLPHLFEYFWALPDNGEFLAYYHHTADGNYQYLAPDN